MIYSQILTSLIFIVSGFLVKKYPNLIAGYNSMSEEEKQKVNINALSTFLKRLLIGLGLFTVAIFCLSILIDVDKEMVLTINTIIMLFGVIIGLIYVNTNKKFKN